MMNREGKYLLRQYYMFRHQTVLKMMSQLHKRNLQNIFLPIRKNLITEKKLENKSKSVFYKIEIVSLIFGLARLSHKHSRQYKVDSLHNSGSQGREQENCLSHHGIHPSYKEQNCKRRLPNRPILTYNRLRLFDHLRGIHNFYQLNKVDKSFDQRSADTCLLGKVLVLIGIHQDIESLKRIKKINVI